MKFVEPVVEGKREQQNYIIFSASQSHGQRANTQDFFSYFSDECFVLADGAASQLAGETAIWGYKQIRQHYCYWVDKKSLIKRIFRSSNIAVWQKQREAGSETGLATSLLVVIVGPHKIWLGSVGEVSCYLYRQGRLEKLTREDRDPAGGLTKGIGLVRYGLIPQNISRRFAPNDIVLLATSGVASYISTRDIQLALSSAGETAEELAAAVGALFGAATSGGSLSNMSACVIKRLPHSD